VRQGEKSGEKEGLKNEGGVTGNSGWTSNTATSRFTPLLTVMPPEGRASECRRGAEGGGKAGGGSACLEPTPSPDKTLREEKFMVGVDGGADVTGRGR
jgi:hypothetical protein